MHSAAGQPPPPLRPARRLDPAVFHLPVDRMREGYHSDKYFQYSRDVLRADGKNPDVTVQVFAKKEAWLGYAAHIAGAIGVSTAAQASWWGSRGMGTIPHALIACYGGDTVAARREMRDGGDD